LRALGAQWRPALSAIGSAQHVNLLANLPPLPIPRSA
jgi:hypothetical protein